MAALRGGAKLEGFLRSLGDKLRRPVTLRVGFLQGATYPDGTPVAMVAAIQNFGAPRAGIPPRPFFSNMVDDKSGEWSGAMAGLLKQTGYDVEKSFELLGDGIAGQLRQSIVDFSGVPLKPATIARKGFSKELIDTGHMLNSVSFEVKT